MSLTVIQYADSVRLAVMTDARLSPGHSIPAVRWPTAVEQLVAKIDAEIARISAQSQPEIPQIVTPPETEETNDESDNTSRSQDPTGTLRPPNTQVASPPPFRKRTTLH